MFSVQKRRNEQETNNSFNTRAYLKTFFCAKYKTKEKCFSKEDYNTFKKLNKCVNTFTINKNVVDSQKILDYMKSNIAFLCFLCNFLFFY